MHTFMPDHKYLETISNIAISRKIIDVYVYKNIWKWNKAINTNFKIYNWFLNIFIDFLKVI